MKTIILPGYSIKNKDWAYEVKKRLPENFNIIVHEWEHWDKGSIMPAETEVLVGPSNNQKLDYKLSLQVAKRLDIKREVERISKKIKSTEDEINIIAKSIGTKVAMSLAQIIKKRLRKVILCGIPIDPLGYRRGLKIIGCDNLLVIQNDKDPFMSYRAIKIHMKIMNKNIKVIKKSLDTHDYPYYKDFAGFLEV